MDFVCADGQNSRKFRFKAYMNPLCRLFYAIILSFCPTLYLLFVIAVTSIFLCRVSANPQLGITPQNLQESSKLKIQFIADWTCASRCLTSLYAAEMCRISEGKLGRFNHRRDVVWCSKPFSDSNPQHPAKKTDKQVSHLSWWVRLCLKHFDFNYFRDFFGKIEMGRAPMIWARTSIERGFFLCILQGRKASWKWVDFPKVC